MSNTEKPIDCEFTPRSDRRGFNVTVRNVTASEIQVTLTSPSHGVELLADDGEFVRCGSEFAPRHYGPITVPPNGRLTASFFLAGLFAGVSGTFLARVRIACAELSGRSRTVMVAGRVPLNLPSPAIIRRESRERQITGDYSVIQEVEIKTT